MGNRVIFIPTKGKLIQTNRKVVTPSWESQRQPTVHVEGAEV